VDDDEPSIPDGIEISNEAIDLPIQTSGALKVGDGLRPKPTSQIPLNQPNLPREQSEIEVDSEDLPEDEDDEEEEFYEEDAAESDGAENAALLEESQNLEDAVINILDDPLALSMTMRQQYE